MKRGVIALVKKNGKLLILNKKEGFHTISQFPTCEVKENEEPETTVLINLKENLNLDAELRDFIDLLILPKSTIYFYDCYPLSENITVPKKFTGYSWIEVKKLQEHFPKQAIDALPKEVLKSLGF